MSLDLFWLLISGLSHGSFAEAIQAKWLSWSSIDFQAFEGEPLSFRMLNHVYSSLSCRVQQVEVCTWNSTEEVGTEMRFDFHAMLWFHWRNFTSWKINMEHVLMEVWFRSFSFLNGWFVCSMLIFRGVALILLGSITAVRPKKWGFSPKERCLSSNHQFFFGRAVKLGGVWLKYFWPKKWCGQALVHVLRIQFSQL